MNSIEGLMQSAKKKRELLGEGNNQIPEAFSIEMGPGSQVRRTDVSLDLLLTD